MFVALVGYVVIIIIGVILLSVLSKSKEIDDNESDPVMATIYLFILICYSVTMVLLFFGG